MLLLLLLLLLGLCKRLLVLLLLLLVELFVLGRVLGFRSELSRGGSSLLLELLHLLEQSEIDVRLLLLLQLELVLALLPFGFLQLEQSLLVELLFHLLLQHLVGRLDADLLVDRDRLGNGERSLLVDGGCLLGGRHFRLYRRRFRGRLKDYRGDREAGHFPLAELLLVFGRWRTDDAVAGRNGTVRRSLLLTR